MGLSVSFSELGKLVLFCYFAPPVGAGGTKIEHRFALLSRAVNPFTAMLGVPSLQKRPIKVPNFTSLRPFFPPSHDQVKRITIKIQSTESRFVIRPSNRLFASV